MLLGPLRDGKDMAQMPDLGEGQGVDDGRLTLEGKLMPLPRRQALLHLE